MAKVSIITPVYIDIVEKIDWLIETIESVRSQTMTDWEMVLLDDKSPIEPSEAKYKYADDPRIRWLENAQNEGPAKTRNSATAAADSECILPLDSDDLLAGPEVLEKMYDIWSKDQTKIIYGNLQMYTPDGSSGKFKRHPKVFDFGEYTFELALNLKGFIPVTAMHSKQCHIDSGGWKAELDYGLEDVEKWIMAGKRGYCGQRIGIIAFLYRKQEESRSHKMIHVNKEFETMQQKIKAMHADVYAGRFPMACCGKGGANVAPSLDPIILSQQAKKGMIIPLEEYEEKDLEWVKYVGGKRGRHDVMIRTNPQRSYTIFGIGQVFQIHKNHHKSFEDRQKWGFQMNQPDPRNREPEPEPVAAVERPPEITEVPPPELSTILRLDSKAPSTVFADIQPMPTGFIQPETEIHHQAAIFSQPAPAVDHSQAERDYADRMEKAAAKRAGNETKYQLSALELSPRITDTLTQDGWIVERLAETTPQRLATYAGIGVVGAKKIIAKAVVLVGG